MTDGVKGNGPLAGTLLRGLALLDTLLAASHPMTLAELAADVKLDLSTTLRLLRTLEDAKRVIRIGDGKYYLASPSTLRPLALKHPLEELRRQADPLVRGLANKVSQSVVLVAYIGGERVVVDVMQAGTSLNPYYTTWLHGPLHASGPGKALLLASDPARREALLGKPPYAARTNKTLTTKTALDADLERAAANGYVLVRDEFYDGLSAIAANFYSWDKTALGCLAITAYSESFDDETIALVAKELLACTRLMPLQVPALQQIAQLSGR
ncbi:Acetate operon repressor [Achromobacter denitrificans]|jgi:IclR family acetate operon transcriptional repressor|uniref:IclR family transcriptional regulator n=1 Tax=Achromobacter denitrificans TaxID=32002 RepID=UPI00078702BC|nr:IclR family transcriptional regulator C-terminal domain-containing protein [Achromobacter denitrificans]QKH45294.1 helix-turn-helix domain-containing protein [Achromobacter denitrificans]QKH53364.1 helix-turn-helix domain-containing protein [Achromobacter denitrificans]CAB3672118.1 Transcriptional repressor IclR [Achromobacter denitrificans]SUW34197.1 Acetate operon repressor [Achromobacter denitrificans]